MNEQDTIAAISTATGVGAISIIRVSGPEALAIVNSLFKGKNLFEVSSHTIHYGYIVENEEIIDEVLITVMLAPKTFTTEDIVEINCHGGIATTNKILQLLLAKGARLAEPGEFTKRAFLNGRINLLEAESVSDLIEAKSSQQRKLALNGLSGRSTKIIQDLRDQILDIIANIEVNIDYPEYEDAPEITQANLKQPVIEIQKQIEKIYQNSEIGKIIKSGLDIALIGRPNVGKSSLLNALLNEEKAIVTDISGTTRDLIEGKMQLNGIEINLIDTAGIRETTDMVEKIGVDKSKKIIDSADLVILVLNNNEPLTAEDQKLINLIQNKPHIIFLNKTDLESKLVLDPTLTNLNMVKGNTKELNGLDDLKQKIIDMYNLDKISQKDLTYLSNARQIDIIQKSLQNINTLLAELEKAIPVDMLEIYLRNAFDLLGTLIGETYEDELIDKLFTNFCLGK